MKGLLESIFARQTPPPGSSEGLPYWIFWLLLCVILLLIAFIFLRDKDLRRRINLFLFGAKKKLIKIRLQARLKREYRKNKELHRNLGKKAWEETLEIPEGEKICQELTKLEEHKQELEQESNDVHSKIAGLEADMEKFMQDQKDLLTKQESERKPYQEKLSIIKDEEKVLGIEITQKQKEMDGIVQGIQSSENLGDEKIEELDKKRKEADKAIKELIDKRLNLENERKDHIGKIEEFDKKLRKIEEGGKKRNREFQKEIREWKKAKEKLQEKIVSVEKKKGPLFENLGKHADETRLELEELSVFYSQIDRSNERIGELEEQIHNL